MADKEFNSAVNQVISSEVLKEQNTMEDLWNSFIQEEILAVKQPVIDAEDFELDPVLITMVQQNQFTGRSTENSNEHLGRFLRIANSVKVKGVRPEVIQLQLFPFSLRDMAAKWFNSLPNESVNTWDELIGAYFSKFPSQSYPTAQETEIANFKSGEDKNMNISWKELAENNIRLSGSSERNGRAEESKMNVMDKLSAIEVKLDELIYFMNDRKSN